MITKALMIIIGYSTGMAIAAGVFAFIAAIGIVPRMAQRSQTTKYIRLYEDMILLGGLFGTTAMFVDYRLPQIPILAGGLALAIGVFVGVLAVALTEVLNVIPILMRRSRITKGLSWLLLSFALGKVLGSLVYFCVDGFYVL
ncbi:stage V sporulation protein AB [Anaerotignum sp. MB30-C6]|uniref:stage V sporulation protein AB n=1 Tax=Anaerotignum sp. MB30-C6 TaxID=3070814 RepID=UPI0027DC550E|nr:stage V sporulation protein AB [Anaerotignum sp. MB30-C6]WMI81970.1 stage V sporulation protein AB [Anaerotignum sp. MB30-C6]